MLMNYYTWSWINLVLDTALRHNCWNRCYNEMCNYEPPGLYLTMKNWSLICSADFSVEAARDVRHLQQDREFQKEAHHFFIQVCYGFTRAGESSTPNHQTMHTLNKGKKRKEKRKKEQRKHTDENLHFSLNISQQSLLCMFKRDPHWSVLYRHQFQNCDRGHQSVQRDRQTTWMQQDGI